MMSRQRVSLLVEMENSFPSENTFQMAKIEQQSLGTLHCAEGEMDRPEKVRLLADD